jgi:NADPH:quinone reductase
LALKPSRLTFEEAAAVSQGYLTAWQVLTRLPLKKEDSIFITGAAGSVGLALVKLFLAHGYKQLIVTAGNAESTRQLINGGLPEGQIVNYRQEDLVAKVISANSGALFNHSVDLVGGAMSEICARVIVTNGSYADVTALVTPDAREGLFNKGALILNISNYAYSLSGDKKWYGDNLRKIALLLTENAISVPDVNVVGALSVQTVSKAHNLMERNQTQGKKLVMQVVLDDSEKDLNFYEVLIRAK